jgi:hypothetical protein
MARAAPDANAVTQVLPVVRADVPLVADEPDPDEPLEPQPVGARHPAGRDLTWARHSYQGQRRTSTPISRPRLLIVFGLVAATALATVMTLVGGEPNLPEPSPDSDDSLLIAPGVPGEDPPMPIVPPPPPSPTGPSDDAGPSAHPNRTPPSSTPAANRTARATAGPRTVPNRGAASAAAPGQPGAPDGPGVSGGSSGSGGRLTAPVSFEAESPANTVGGAAARQPFPPASGGQVVANLGWLRFNGVRAPSPGRYALTVYYLSAGAGAATMQVNDQQVSAVPAFPATTAVRSVTVVVSLRAGTNTIQFGNPGGVAPSIDRVTVRAA